MQYVTIENCKRSVFPYIYDQLSGDEPSAQYELESEGLAELDKVLQWVQSDTFYPTLADKTAYILCSIAGSQYFSNGNKRLAVITLTFFLIVNDAEMLLLSTEEYQKILARFFPLHVWENNPTINKPGPLFLYNLAIIIDDRNQWGTDKDFNSLKKTVAEIFSLLYRLPQ